jgi:hypothetical protein
MNATRMQLIKYIPKRLSHLDSRLGKKEEEFHIRLTKNRKAITCMK